MNNTIKKVAGSAIAAIAIAAAATMLLPREVHVTRTAFIKAEPSTILALAASNAGYQKFNPYVGTDPSLAIELTGPASGVGSAFRFTAADVSGTQTVAAVSSTKVNYDLDLGYMGQPKQSIEAVTEGDGSRVTWTMHADMGFNPIGRVMGLFMDGMQGPVFETGLNKLKTVAQS
jgi:ABC-type transport system substrate-binding protein